MKGRPCPDYDSSILSLVASIGKHYGVDTGYAGLKAADAALAGAPRTVVLMVFDGMGASALERNLPPDSFSRRNRASSISTVFPSTTVAAMTSFYSGLSPLEHGWLGWSLYFKEYGRTIDTFLDRDSFSRKPLGPRGIARTIMPYADLGERISSRSEGKVAACTVNPSHIERNPDERHAAVKDLGGFFSAVGEMCSAPGEKYVMAYWDDPDSTMHKRGPYSAEAKAVYAEIDAGLERLSTRVKNAIFFVTADHGQVDIEACVDLASIPEIMECLAMPPFIESRAASLSLIPGSERRFKKAFAARFGKEFLLMSRREVLRSGLLGRGRAHAKIGDFLGDYLAVAVGGTMLAFQSKMPDDVDPVFKGHHAGLRPEEMLVPLIIARAEGRTTAD